MKNLLLFCALVFAGFYLSAYTTSSSSNDEPSFVQSFDVSGEAALNLSTSGGSIKVIQGAQDQVVVEFFVRKGGKVQNMSLDQLREHKEVLISQEGNNIKVSIKGKNRSWRSTYSVAFVAYTPRKTMTALATSGGSLNVSGIDGIQKMATSGGSIKLADIIGDINASTSGGSIKGQQLYGSVNVSTSGGSIKMMQVDGSLDASTSGGSISLQDINGSARAATSGGSITANFTNLDGDLSLATSGGSIKVDLPNDVAANIDLSATSSATLDISGFSGETKKNKVRGQLNGGGHNVSCRTSGGAVRVF